MLDMHATPPPFFSLWQLEAENARLRILVEAERKKNLDYVNILESSGRLLASQIGGSAAGGSPSPSTTAQGGGSDDQDPLTSDALG